MTFLCDLHLHSTTSDGQYSPAELVRMAREKGLEVIALTDHDTADGVAEAQRVGEELGVRVIPGIEMSAIEYPTFHILGYGFSTVGTPIADFCVDLLTGRRDRAMRIINFLKEKGMEITMEEVETEAGGVSIGRPVFGRIMLNKGYISNYRDAFNLYLDTDEFHEKVDYAKPSGRECVEIIKASGGKVSLAHPYQTGLDGEELEALVRRMKDWGLDAIECYHSGHTREMIAKYLALAKKYDLHVTGGSDFHGEKVKPEIQLASLELELDWLLG